MEESRSLTIFRASDGNNVRLEYHDALYNTADLAKRYAKAGYPDRYVVFTEKQATSSLTGSKLSEGEFERGIFISCVLRPSLFPSQASIIVPLSTLALATALESHTEKKIGINWLSTIICEGKKIGGCHADGKLNGDRTSYEYMIVSFAVRLDDKNFPPLLKDMIKKVFEPSNVSIGTIIAKNILNNFFNIYKDIRSSSQYMEAYKSRISLMNKKVKYISNDTRIKARIVDVDKQNGNLILKLKNGELIKVTSPKRFIPIHFGMESVGNIDFKKISPFRFLKSISAFNFFKAK